MVRRDRHQPVADGWRDAGAAPARGRPMPKWPPPGTFRPHGGGPQDEDPSLYGAYSGKSIGRA